jgi:ribonuclease G
VRKLAADVDGPAVQLRVNPDIARALREEEPAVLREMQDAVGKRISIRSDPHMHHEQFDVMVL